jgi:hypothetical protein
MKTNLQAAWVEKRSSNSGYINGILIMFQVEYKSYCRCALSISNAIRQKVSLEFADSLPDIE